MPDVVAVTTIIGAMSPFAMLIVGWLIKGSSARIQLTYMEERSRDRDHDRKEREAERREMMGEIRRVYDQIRSMSHDNGEKLDRAAAESSMRHHAVLAELHQQGTRLTVVETALSGHLQDGHGYTRQDTRG